MHYQATPQDTTPTADQAIDTYNVHLLTLVRVTFSGIKASSPEEAAEIAENSDLNRLIRMQSIGNITDAQFQDEPSQTTCVQPVLGGEALQNLELLLDANRRAKVEPLAYLRRLYDGKPKDAHRALLEPFLHMPAGTSQADAEAWFGKLNPERGESVQVAPWNAYETDDPVLTHTMTSEDQRQTSGQFFLTISGDESVPDDTIAVTAEVNTNPLNGLDGLPCLHVHFDDSNLALSIFKLGNQLLIRPEADVTINTRPHTTHFANGTSHTERFLMVRRDYCDPVDSFVREVPQRDWTARQKSAQDAYEAYDFGDEKLTGHDGWEWTDGEDTMNRIVYSDSGRIRFTVSFTAGSDVAECIAHAI